MLKASFFTVGPARLPMDDKGKGCPKSKLWDTFSSKIEWHSE